LGEARPAWKVLRVLGNLLGLSGFEFNNIGEVRAACLGTGDVASRLSNRLRAEGLPSRAFTPGIQRIADVPMYFTDPLVRRSPPLQETTQARAPKVRLNARMMEKLGIRPGQPVLIQGKAKLEAALDAGVPDGCVRVAAGHASTVDVGPMFGTVALEKIEVGRAA
jgi:NADH-quinone oxidoreductase subunit G